MIDIRMRILTGLVPVATALVLLAGCRGNMEVSEADQILNRFRELPVAERESALREFVATAGDEARYAWYELGNVYYERASNEEIAPGENSLTGTNALLDSALVCFERAIACDSTYVEAIVNEGLIWDDLGEGRTPEARQAMKTAVELYERAIAIRPEDEKAHCNLGALHMRRHHYESALKEFQAVLEHDPESALAHFNMAIMFADSKMYREAITEWELASKYDDGDIRERAEENIRVMKQLMEAEIPESLTTRTEVQGH